MRNLTRYLLCAFVFTVPWDVFAFPLVGSVSRILGLAATGAGVLTMIAMQGRLRKPDAVLGFVFAFHAWGALSLLWTVSYGMTVAMAATSVQLIAIVWLIREFVRTREEMEPLLAALCFGFFVPLTDLLNNFRRGASIGGERFTGAGLNADIVGLLLVFGLPIAWHLLMHRHGIVRVAGLIYVVTAPVALLLTAVRGAFVAGIAALAIVPLTLPRQLLRSYALAGAMLVLSSLSVAQIVPRSSWERILTISSELGEGGSMSGRTDFWNAGLQAFPQRPLLGAGAGAYGTAIYPYLPNDGVILAHNSAIGLLVEEGIIGLALFVTLLGACAWTILRSPAPYRALFGVLILIFLVGGMSQNPERMKLTWVLVGLVSAQSGLARSVSDASRTEHASYTASESMTAATF